MPLRAILGGGLPLSRYGYGPYNDSNAHNAGKAGQDAYAPRNTKTLRATLSGAPAIEATDVFHSTLVTSPKLANHSLLCRFLQARRAW
jgi:hypothetical protein